MMPNVVVGLFHNHEWLNILMMHLFVKINLMGKDKDKGDDCQEVDEGIM
jgi:hypothetical protein